MTEITEFQYYQVLDENKMLKDDNERLKGIIQTERSALCEWEKAFNQIELIARKRKKDE